MPLRFDPALLPRLAADYPVLPEENNFLAAVGHVQANGCIDLPFLSRLATWKSPRRARRILLNAHHDVTAVSSIALSARTERPRIKVLLGLYGVDFPTASVILHFFHADPYPIMDKRALWSLHLPYRGPYSFKRWEEYVAEWRQLRTLYGMGKRELDRALWQYSKEQGQPQD